MIGKLDAQVEEFEEEKKKLKSHLSAVKVRVSSIILKIYLFSDSILERKDPQAGGRYRRKNRKNKEKDA